MPKSPAETPRKSEVALDRRQLIGGTAALAAGAALSGTQARSRAVDQIGGREIRVALVGCGGRGTGAAAQALATEGPVKLVAMADAFEDRLGKSLENLQKVTGERQQAQRLDVPPENRYVGFDAYRKAIDAGADMVILATPPGFRPEHFAYAIESGKHVFMEKPVAVDAPGIRSVMETAKLSKEKGLKVGVGLQRHHYPLYQETVARIHDGAIGDVVAQRVYWNSSGVWVRPREPQQTEMEYQMRNWYYFNWLCGDHIVEQHIHNLDVANWVKNAHPVEAQGQGGRQVRNGLDHGEIFDHHMVEYTYADGSTMSSQCRHIPGCWEQVAEFAHGSKGSAEVAAGVLHMKGRDTWYFGEDEDDPYQLEHDHLFAAMREGTEFNEAEHGAIATMTAILGRMATYTGKKITWDEALASTERLAPERYAFDANPPSLPDEDGRYAIAVPGKS